MSIRRVFGDLRVRPKLMVLHNLFFLVLTAAAYFSLIPQYRKQVEDAREREFRLITQVVRQEQPLSRAELPPAAREFLDRNAGGVWKDPAAPGNIYIREARTDQYRRLIIPEDDVEDSVRRAEITLFLILGALYLLAVLLLELLIMPLYVYTPIQRMLDADDATQRGDREREMIPDSLILGDEIGQIMRSRNATVAQLRGREDDLRHKNEMLEVQDRLASLGLMSASVAHEMNTPLAVLHGSIEKLLESAPAGSPLQERLARMRRVTERLRKISESLLDFARARREKMEPLHLAPLIDEAWTLVAIDEKASDVSFVNCVAADARVNGNADRLVQVFVNLLRNALHAVRGGPGSRVEVKSEQMRLGGESWLSVKFEDNGSGIPPEVLPGIFDAFVTTRLDSKGTGLGLTVAEGIVSQHGGSIHASNRPEGGACLEVRLPSCAGAAANAPIEGSAAQPHG